MIAEEYLTPEIEAETRRLQGIVDIYRGPSGYVYAWPHRSNSLGGYIVTGGEGGARRELPRVKHLKARTSGTILQSVYWPLLRELKARGIHLADVGLRKFESALGLAVRRVHRTSMTPYEAAESVAKDIEEAMARGVVSG